MTNPITFDSAKQLLTSIIKADTKRWFLLPVDPVAEGLPDYYDKISTPMDFTTIRKRLDANDYDSTQLLINDIELVFTNAIKYNGASSSVGAEAMRLRVFFEQRYSGMMKQQAAKASASASNSNSNSEGKPLSSPSNKQKVKNNNVADKTVKQSAASASPTESIPKTVLAKTQLAPTVVRPVKTEANSSNNSTSSDALQHLPLNSSNQAAFESILNQLMAEQGAKDWFNYAVDPKAVPDYLKIVKHPMDLGTIRTTLRSRKYADSSKLHSDVNLVWFNCKLYNPVGHPTGQAVRDIADKLSARWNVLLSKTLRTLHARAPELPLTPTAPSAPLTPQQPQQPPASQPDLRSTLQAVHKQFRLQGHTLNELALEWFMYPVDQSQFTDYTSIVKHPIDLTSIAGKIASGLYDSDLVGFLCDMLLVFRNAQAYNESGSEIDRIAKQFAALFDTVWKTHNKNNVTLLSALPIAKKRAASLQPVHGSDETVADDVKPPVTPLRQPAAAVKPPLTQTPSTGGKLKLKLKGFSSASATSTPTASPVVKPAVAATPAAIPSPLLSRSDSKPMTPTPHRPSPSPTPSPSPSPSPAPFIAPTAFPSSSRRPDPKLCHELLSKLKRRPFTPAEYAMYYEPVDEVKHLAPDYYKVITKPMCFQEVARRIDSNEYTTYQQFVDDTNQIFLNSQIYNPRGVYREIAEQMQQAFNRNVQVMLRDYDVKPNFETIPAPPLPPVATPSKSAQSQLVPASTVKPERSESSMKEEFARPTAPASAAKTAESAVAVSAGTAPSAAVDLTAQPVVQFVDDAELEAARKRKRRRLAETRDIQLTDIERKQLLHTALKKLLEVDIALKAEQQPTDLDSMDTIDQDASQARANYMKLSQPIRLCPPANKQQLLRQRATQRRLSVFAADSIDVAMDVDDESHTSGDEINIRRAVGHAAPQKLAEHETCLQLPLREAAVCQNQQTDQLMQRLVSHYGFHWLDDNVIVQCNQLDFPATHLMPHPITQTTFALIASSATDVELALHAGRSVTHQEYRHLQQLPAQLKSAQSLDVACDQQPIALRVTQHDLQRQEEAHETYQALWQQPGFRFDELQWIDQFQSHVLSTTIPVLPDSQLVDFDVPTEVERLAVTIVRIITLANHASFALNGQAYVPSLFDTSKLVCQSAYNMQLQREHDGQHVTPHKHFEQHEVEQRRRQHLMSELQRLKHEHRQWLRASFRAMARRARRKWLHDRRLAAIQRRKDRQAEDEEKRRARVEAQRKLEFKRYIEGQKILESAVLAVTLSTYKNGRVAVRIEPKKRS